MKSDNTAARRFRLWFLASLVFMAPVVGCTSRTSEDTIPKSDEVPKAAPGQAIPEGFKVKKVKID